MALPITVRTQIIHGRLVVDLPNEVDGEVEVIVQPVPSDEVAITVEEARARLLAGGSLQTRFGVDEPVEDASDEELEILGRLPEGSPTILDMLNDDRGAY